MTFKSKMYGQMSGWRPDRCAISAVSPRGLTVVTEIIVPVVNSVSEAADQQYSYVFVATKAVPDVIKTSDILRPLLTSPHLEAHRQPIYVLVQNGLNVEVDLYDAIQRLGQGEPQIVSVALWIATNMLENNVVEHGDFVCLLTL
jgi:2-dehydropantoate 2-reductase